MNPTAVIGQRLPIWPEKVEDWTGEVTDDPGLVIKYLIAIAFETLLPELVVGYVYQDASERGRFGNGECR